jgi:hypothetical protein
MTDYYYLISSLPKIGLGEKHDKLDFYSVYNTILENVTASDKKLLQYLIYPNDNKNLIAAITHRYKKPIVFHYFHQPSVFSKDVIYDFTNQFDQLPHYMQEFFEDCKEDFAVVPVLELEKVLLGRFYQEVFATGDEFLEKYYSFQLNLRNIAIALNSRLYGFYPQDEIIGESPINRQLIKSTASDFNLGNEFPFIENLSEALNSKDPNYISHQYDTILWNHIDEIVSFSFFNTHKLMGYVAHLLIIKRWMDLNKEEGRKRLDELTNKAMENFELPQLHK